MHEHALNEIIMSLAVKKRIDGTVIEQIYFQPSVVGKETEREATSTAEKRPAILFNLISEELLAGNLLLNII